MSISLARYLNRESLFQLGKSNAACERTSPNMASEDKHIASPGCSDTKDDTLMEDIAEVGHAATDQ